LIAFCSLDSRAKEMLYKFSKDAMRPNETITVGDDSKEVRDFLEKLRDAREMVVQLGTETFVVTMKRSVITTAGRATLSKGGPADSNEL